MSPNAEKIMHDLAEQYVAAGYPGHHLTSFRPSEGEDIAFNELRARGLIERFTSSEWRLTNEGLEWVLNHKGETQAALTAIRDIGRLYIEAGYPEAGCWSFGAEEGDEAALGELRDRGLVERFTNAHWRLTDDGVQRIMRNVAA